MNRRSFLKGMSAMTALALFPHLSYGATAVDLTQATFDSATYSSNSAQTIMIYLYGGASELGGNLTNLDEIQAESQNKYNLNQLTKTTNHFWEQAGGDVMERMLASGDMNIFRTCYREDNTSKSHGECTAENQRGLMDIEEPTFGAGIFATLGKVLAQNGAITSATRLPFLTMEGESSFFSSGPYTLEAFLRPASMDENLSNPYSRSLGYPLYSGSEWESDPRPSETEISRQMDTLAAQVNQDEKLQHAFEQRGVLDAFMQEQQAKGVPDGIVYPNTSFGRKLKGAVNILTGNPDTKVISLGGGGLGGWDDHSDAIDEYSSRMRDLMESIEIALAHLKSLGKSNVNIVVFAEFGRNANLNDSEGWDHGNLQNVFIFGGKQYFNHVGIVGETELQPTQSNNRLYLQPTSSSYKFEPYAVAATIYKMYGITNPEVLTRGYGAIEAGLFKST
jgi:hypothetical protein